MKKGIFFGTVSMAMMLALAGCGDEKRNVNTSDKTNAGQTESSEDIQSETGNADAESRFEDSLVLTLDYTDDDVLTAPDNAYLFSDKLTLPIKFDDLLDYQVSSHEHVDGDDSPLATYKLSDQLEEDTYEVDGSELIVLYDKSYTSVADEGGIHMPSLRIGKDGEKNTLKGYVNDGMWWLDDKVGSYADGLGIDDEEMQKLESAMGDENESFCLKVMVNRFGNPNFINVAFSDMAEAIDGTVNTEKYESGICVNQYTVGWIYDDYQIYAYVVECPRTTSSGEHSVVINEMDVMYYSSGFDSTERGENMVTDLLKIRNEQYPDVSLYARTDIGASARTSTGTENAASDNENTAVTEESTLAGKSNYVDCDRDFSEQANDDLIFIDDCYKIGDKFVVAGNIQKGNFQQGDAVYVKLANGMVVEGTLSAMEANTNRDGYAMIIDGLDESDREYVRASYVIKK